MVISGKIDRDVAQQIGAKLNINQAKLDLDEFKDALNVEINAEIKEGVISSNQNIPDNELEAMGRITMAHMQPFYD